MEKVNFPEMTAHMVGASRALAPQQHMFDPSSSYQLATLFDSEPWPNVPSARLLDGVVSVSSHPLKNQAAETVEAPDPHWPHIHIKPGMESTPKKNDMWYCTKTLLEPANTSTALGPHVLHSEGTFPSID